MLRTISILILLLSFSVMADFKDAGNFAQKESKVRLELRMLGLDFIDVANLWFKNKEDIVMSTMDLYVTQYNSFGYPHIIESFVGHSAQINFAELNGDESKEIAIRYKTGANLTVLNLYRVKQGAIEKIKGAKLFSNMNHIEIINEPNRPPYIVVKNTTYDDGNDQIVDKEVFYLDGFEITPIKQ